MNTTRSILLCALLLTGVSALAQTTPPSVPPGQGAETGSGPRFDAAKQKHLEHLQMWLNCVRQSTTFETMRACRPHRER